MKKILLSFFIILIVLILGCSANKNSDLNSSSIICTKDVKICFDNSIVSREPPSCEFLKCLDVKNDLNINLNKLKICPDKKIINKMPQIISKNQTFKRQEYFIVNGKKDLLSKYDLNWIIKNCNVKNEVVY